MKWQNASINLWVLDFKIPVFTAMPASVTANPATIHETVGVLRTDEYPCDAGVDERVGTRGVRP